MVTQSGSLKGPDGVEYATYTVDENGKVTITFTENVTKEIDINGDFNFETKFDTQHIDDLGITKSHFRQKIIFHLWM